MLNTADFYHVWRIDQSSEQLKEEIKEHCHTDIERCLECGKCSGGCSNAHIFDITPRKIIQLIKIGEEAKLLKMDFSINLKMPWDRSLSMNWKEVSVLTEGVCVEAIAGIFHHLGSGGVIIEDPQAARKYVKKEPWDAKAVSQDFLKHQFIVVRGYFPMERQVMDELKLGLATVESNFGIKCRVYVDEVKDEDWESSWKKYYHTFKVGERLVIKPSWEEYQALENEIIIEIDPGMAFGTGIHASTRFCLVFAEEYIKGGEQVIDAGCGSGILSIAAAKLGASSVEAMDIDEVAVRVARENIALNKLEDIIRVRAANVAEEMADMTAQVIMANITAEVVERLIPIAAEILPRGGYFFGSGIVDSRWPGVEKQLKNCGFIMDQILTDTDWVGVAAIKSD